MDLRRFDTWLWLAIAAIILGWAIHLIAPLVAKDASRRFERTSARWYVGRVTGPEVGQRNLPGPNAFSHPSPNRLPTISKAGALVAPDNPFRVPTAASGEEDLGRCRSHIILLV